MAFFEIQMTNRLIDLLLFVLFVLFPRFFVGHGDDFYNTTSICAEVQ